MPGISTAIAVVAGYHHSCAILADHTGRCWGWNNQGELGDGTTTDRSAPVPVSGSQQRRCHRFQRRPAHCARLDNGSIRCWGDNELGQLGDGTTTDRHSPVTVTGIFTATAIAAGHSHTCALLADHTLRCWGHNYFGSVGDGTIVDRRTPVKVVGISTATAITTGAGQSCSILADGSAWCWGEGEFGQLGNGTPTPRQLTPIAVIRPSAPFTDIANSVFKSDIEWAYLTGLSSGCSPTLYCPGTRVTREQMASFLARALGLQGNGVDVFTDDETSIHEPNINRVYAAGITTGCGGSKFCPKGIVSRGQMASFLSRALDLSGPAPNAFTDDNGSIHEPNINLIAREGIATGCGGGKYCPTASVTRGQMAAFLHRAFGP